MLHRIDPWHHNNKLVLKNNPPKIRNSQGFFNDAFPNKKLAIKLARRFHNACNLTCGVIPLYEITLQTIIKRSRYAYPKNSSGTSR